MAQDRPFRFGTSLQATSRAELLAQVRKAQDWGYSAITVTDHVSTPRLAPIATLAAVAALDTSLRLTSTVFGNDFRHPAFLASEAAAIDIISDGRLELGIGTGWMGPDYETTGIALDSPGIRIERLGEAIDILKLLFSGEPVSYAGQHYTIRDLTLQPKPVQRPHPPLLIGGGGKRMLSLAGREADIVSINPVTTEGGMDFSTYAAGAFAQKLAWVREAAGERFEHIELHALLFWVIETDDQEQAAQQWLQQVGAMSFRRGQRIDKGPGAFSVEDVLASPYLLIGTIEQMVGQLQARRQQYGLSYFTTASYIGPETFGPLVAQLAGT